MGGVCLLFLKSAVLELERARVLSDDADDLSGRAVGDFGLDFQGQPHFCAGQPGKVSNDLFRDLACIAPGAGRVQLD